MPISFDKKLIFIHIPKCAGSSIESALNIDYNVGLRSIGGVRCSDLHIPNIDVIKGVERVYVNNTSPQHLPANILKRLIPQQFAEYNKFTIVRNPYDKIVSEYLYLYNRYKMPFSELLKYVFNLSKLDRYVEFDSHFSAQSSFIYESNELLVDKVFKFEDIGKVFDWLQLPEVHVNASNRTKPWQDYYNIELKELVCNFYREDFERFGYTL